MAGIEIEGFEELRRNIDRICGPIVDRAIRAAQDAAARVIKAALEASAPRKTGRLARSIIIYEGRDRNALTQSSRRRILVGPDKKKGFYGYFYDAGRRGFALKAKKAKALRWGQGADLRYAKHAQVGSQPARAWFETVAATTESQAHDAGVAAFQAVIDKELGK